MARTRFERGLLATLALCVGLAMPAMAQETLTLAAGQEGGGYDAYSLTAAQKLEQRQHTVEVVNMAGSAEITLAVCGGVAVAGLTQIDAMFARSKEGCALRPVATYGQGEMALILFPPNSDIDELDELTAASSVLVGGVGSGTSLFWDTIVSIEMGDDGNKNEWAKASPINDSITMAGTLASFGDIDAVIIVATLQSTNLSSLLSQGWEVGYLYDKDINDQQFNGQSLYEAEKVNTTISGVRVKNWGYRVMSFAVVTDATRRNSALYADLAAAYR